MLLPKIAAIVVSYNPDESDLLSLCKVINNQVNKVFIVDNTPNQLVFLNDYSGLNVEKIHLNENKGIAYAQNIALRLAVKEGFTDFVLFDQDSIPSNTMISDLLSTRKQALEAGITVAAVGPVHIDQDSLSESIFIQTNAQGLHKILPSTCLRKGQHFTQCDFLIASGCLISEEALETVGYMEDELFIDCVDIEWGFRSLSKGLHCIASFDAKMSHKIGGAPLRIMGRDLTTHSPIRHYYFYRNFYLLLSREYVPASWKRQTIIKSTIQAFIFSLFLAPRYKHFTCIVKGIFHGLTNKMGKYEP